MFDIVNLFEGGSNPWFNILLLLLAMGRIYLELINFRFEKLPLTRGIFKDEALALRFHRNGLYISVLYVIFSAPFTLFSSGS